jgi:hypothetical protein
MDGVTPGWEASGDVTVRSTYPFRINLFGMVLYDGVLQSTTERQSDGARAPSSQMTLCSGRDAARANRSTDSGAASTNGS